MARPSFSTCPVAPSRSKDKDFKYRGLAEATLWQRGHPPLGDSPRDHVPEGPHGLLTQPGAGRRVPPPSLCPGGRTPNTLLET